MHRAFKREAGINRLGLKQNRCKSGFFVGLYLGITVIIPLCVAERERGCE